MARCSAACAPRHSGPTLRLALCSRFVFIAILSSLRKAHVDDHLHGLSSFAVNMLELVSAIVITGEPF